MIEQAAFLFVLSLGVYLFVRQIQRLRKGLSLARPSERHDRPAE